MQCSSCGAPLDAGAVFPGALIPCAMCGAKTPVAGLLAPESPSAAPDRPSQPVGQSTCPRCPGELELRHEGATIVSACREGHGLFLTHKVLREIRKMAVPSGIAAALDDAPKAEVDDVAPTFECPRCREPMARRSLSAPFPVVVDVCAGHGTWFDAGELRDVLGATKTGVAASVATPGEDRLLLEQSGAVLDVSLALENARETEAWHTGVRVADDILDLLFGRSSEVRRRRRNRW